MVLDRVAIGPGVSDGDLDGDPTGVPDDLQEELGQGGQGRDQTFPLDLSLENRLLALEASREEQHPVRQLGLVAVKR